jgi:hypothetical protein
VEFFLKGHQKLRFSISETPKQHQLIVAVRLIHDKALHRESEPVALFRSENGAAPCRLPKLA